MPLSSYDEWVAAQCAGLLNLKSWPEAVAMMEAVKAAPIGQRYRVMMSFYKDASVTSLADERAHATSKASDPKSTEKNDGKKPEAELKVDDDDDFEDGYDLVRKRCCHTTAAPESTDPTHNKALLAV